MTHAYPTPQHEAAAQAILAYFASQPSTAAVLLTNSCARGKATPDSCLDMCILFAPEDHFFHRNRIETEWEHYYQNEQVFRDLEAVGKYSEVHLELTGGEYSPQERDWTSGPDSFEIEIGNFLVYSVPLFQLGDTFRQLTARWRPYYGNALRQSRLAEARMYCLNNLHHIPIYAPRGLYFACMHRLYVAHKEFLQALFISRRVYPLAYDKWIHEQVVEILGLPEVYETLTQILSVHPFTEEIFIQKAAQLEALLEKYT